MQPVLRPAGISWRRHLFEDSARFVQIQKPKRHPSQNGHFLDIQCHNPAKVQAYDRQTYTGLFWVGNLRCVLQKHQPRLRRNFTPLFADNWAAVLQRDARAACLHSEIDKLVRHQWLNWVKEQYSAGVGCSIYNQVVRFRKQSDPKCFEPVNNQADVQLVHIQLKINSSSFDIPEDHHRGRGSWVNQIIDRTWALRADKVVSQW